MISIIRATELHRSGWSGPEFRGSGLMCSGRVLGWDVSSCWSKDQANANHEVVLSYATWKLRFGGDPAIVGVLLNQESYQVVGVMGPEFAWPNRAELWVPIGLPPGRYYDKNFRYNEYLFAGPAASGSVAGSRRTRFCSFAVHRTLLRKGTTVTARFRAGACSACR